MEALVWPPLLLGAWYLTGVAVAHAIQRRLDLPAPAHLAICLAATPVLYSLLAIPLGVAGIDPRWPLVAVLVPGLILGVRRAALRSWSERVRAVPLVLAVPFAVAVFAGSTGDALDLRSDSFAHIAAVRATLEEGQVFPERGFHGDEASRGADPRFGTLHALYGVIARAAGDDLIVSWNFARAIGVAILVAGGLALVAGMAQSGASLWVGALALLVTTGGAYYNALAIAAYPLWFAMGISWTVCAVVVSSLSRPGPFVGALVGVSLAALSGMHFFAFMLCGFLLATLWIAAGRDHRRSLFLRLALALAVAAPFVALRLATSYANANPIHQKVWQGMAWADGLYSVNPIYVLKWLFPFGFAVLLWGVLRADAFRTDLRYRWWIVTAGIVLLWTVVPWILTPSMDLLGFLPLRLYMAIGTPFLLALLLDRQERWRRVVMVGVTILLLPALGGRAREMLPSGTSGVVGTPEWHSAMERLPAGVGERALLVSDPYTMMAARAFRAIDVLAVPDGRSSPRDPHSVTRLRDSWWIMSAAADSARTLEALDRHGVTHLLVNGGLPEGLTSYEYPVSFGSGSREKFAENPAWFRQVWSEGGLVLYERQSPADAGWDDSYRTGCGQRGALAGADGRDIGDGYRLLSPDARVVEGEGGRRLRIDGALRWTGKGAAPDRQLVIRLDRVPPAVPPALGAVGKPLRKVREVWTGRTDRYRFTGAPGGGRCPVWATGELGPLDLELEFVLPAGMESGRYRLSIAARDRSIFVPIRFSDLFVDDDSFQGPTVAVLEVP